MKNGDHLFINKDIRSKSLSSSSGSERAQIFSHVQQEKNRKSVSPSSSSDAVVLPDLMQSCSIGCIGATCNHVKPKSTRRSTRKNSPPIITIKLPVGTIEVPSPSPLVNELDSGNIDPFDTAKVTTTPYVARLLQFYSSTMVDRVFQCKHMAAAARHYSLTYAGQDPLAFNAILATTCGAFYAHTGDERHGYGAMYFKGRAIQHLKREVSKPGDAVVAVSTIYAVSLLLWVECLQGDLKAVQAHIKGLNHLVPRAADLGESPLPAVTMILALVAQTTAREILLKPARCAYYCAAMIGSRPGLTPVVFSDDKVSPTTRFLMEASMEEDQYRRRAGRFFHDANAALLGCPILSLVSQLNESLRFKGLAASGRIYPALDETQYFYTSELAADYHLLDMPHTLPPHEKMRPEVDAVRIALYVFAQPIVALALPTSAFSRAMSGHLRAALEESDLNTLWNSSCDLLVWVLFISAHLSQGQDEWAFFVSNLTLAAESLGICSKEGLKELLSEFFYIPNVYDETLRAVWHDIESLLSIPVL